MDQPLGYAIGNSLEVKEAIATLQGKGPRDLTELCLALGAEMLVKAERTGNLKDARELLETALVNGAALDKFRHMIKSQGGNPNIIENPGLLPGTCFTKEIRSKENGYVKQMDAERIGLIAMELGAGRRQIEDEIDLGAGLEILVKTGDYVKKGQLMGYIYGNSEEKASQAVELVQGALELTSTPVEALPLIFDRISNGSLS